jgi:hypothetical protein
MPVNPGEPIIDDSTAHHHFDVVIDGERKERGLIPRNYTAYPQGYLSFAPPADIQIIPQSEWSARIKEMEETKSRLSDIRMAGNGGQPIPALDQGSWGFCWAHSTTQAVMMLRAINNLPYVPLSAFAVASIIKGGRNQGGWGAQSLDFIRKIGVPSQQFWPQKDASLKHDTPEMRANAALHKVTEDWADVASPLYDQNMTFAQVMTLLLTRNACVLDYNWWSHSVLGIDPVEVEPGSFGIRILNSWSNAWGDLGMGVLRGNKAIPNGAVAPRVTLANVA